MEERKSEGRAWENQIVLCFIPFGSVPLWVLLPMHFHPIFCPRRLYPGIASPGPQHSLVPVEFGQREQIRGQVGRETPEGVRVQGLLLEAPGGLLGCEARDGACQHPTCPPGMIHGGAS